MKGDHEWWVPGAESRGKSSDYLKRLLSPKYFDAQTVITSTKIALKTSHLRSEQMKEELACQAESIDKRSPSKDKKALDFGDQFTNLYPLHSNNKTIGNMTYKQ